jgi:hypothetical protein
MKIYHVDPQSGEYLGESDARESPIEPGIYLVPEFATQRPPPTPGNNQVAALVEGEWQLVEDYRGRAIFYTSNGAYVGKVSGIGPLPPGTTLLPRPSVDHEFNGTAWRVSAALRVARLNEAVNRERMRRIAQGTSITTSTGKTVPVDTRDLTDLVNINGRVQRAQLIPADQTVIFRGSDDIERTITSAEMIEIGLKVADFIEMHYRISWAIKRRLKEQPALDFTRDDVWVLPA